MSDVIARRYAKALFELARERGTVGEWRAELARAAERLGFEQVRSALGNPRVTVKQRSELALGLVEDVSPVVGNLVRLLVERGRAGVLPGAVRAYDQLVDEASGVVRAEVTTAVDVDENVERRIVAALRERLGADVQTTIRRDPQILGGLVVRVGDRVIDSSVRTRLQLLRTALT